MKRIILLLTLFASLPSFSQDQKEPELIKVDIGEFKAYGNMFNAKAFINTDTTLVYFYEIPATHGTPKNYYYEYSPILVISCTPTMKDELTNIYNKYKEWADVAKTNDVGKMTKVIELEYPLYGIILNKKAKGYPKMEKYGSHKFTFKIYDTLKPPSLFSNKDFDEKKGMNYFESLTTGIAFSSPDEFKSFIEFLDPEKVKKRLKENKVFLFN